MFYELVLFNEVRAKVFPHPGGGGGGGVRIVFLLPCLAIAIVSLPLMVRFFFQPSPPGRGKALFAFCMPSPWLSRANDVVVEIVAQFWVWARIFPAANEIYVGRGKSLRLMKKYDELSIVICGRGKWWEGVGKRVGIVGWEKLFYEVV